MKQSGQFFSAEVEDNGKKIYRTYFPQNWTRQDVQEACEAAWDNKEILAAWGNYVILQGKLQGNINVRFISRLDTLEILYHYPMFDISINDKQISFQQPGDSLFSQLKQKVGNLINGQEEEPVINDAMREHLKAQLMNDYRKIVLVNEMDNAIQLKFVLSHNGEISEVDHFIGPRDSGQVPYFKPGILCVMHNNENASVDITDINKEYVFTVHANGSVTQESQEA